MLVRKAYGLLAAIAPPFVSSALTLDVNDQNSIKTAAKSVAENMLTFYPGNKPGGTPGILAQPYYWWEAGAMMGQLINYWNLTGDTSYNDLVYQAMLFQVGSDRNYMPQNQTKDLGNDDQVFWAFAAMDAAEANFRNPPSSEPQWLALAQAVYNSQLPRWETSTCNGGLRWQIYQFNAGYDYKNTISSGGLFQLAARLARFTGNSTYADWAEKTWNWMYGTPIFGKTNGVADGNIWDGVYIVNNCSAATQTYWSYNVGTVLAGAAYMYNYTNGSSLWKDRLDLAIKGTQVFFVDSSGTNAQGGQPVNNNGSIAAEVACEPPDPQTCNNDEPSFKAYLMRWLAVTSQLAPYTHDLVMKRLQASAQAAAGQCSGSINGLTNACGRRWYQTTWDGQNGVGEQMSAMSVIQNNLISHVSPPATGLPSGGGTSQGDANAGIGTSDSDELGNDGLTRPITTGDRAGAGILTALALILVIGGTWWMII